MTQNDPVLQATQEALAQLEQMMLRLHREKAKYHPTQYSAMMAEPLVDEILKLRAQIDVYIGLTDVSASNGVEEGVPTPGRHLPRQFVPAPTEKGIQPGHKQTSDA